MLLLIFLWIYRIEICIWPSGVEDLVAVHDGYEVLGVGEVNDIVSIAGEHDYGLDVFALDFEVEDFG